MILIVDDKAENIFSLKKTLEASGFSVDSAQSGEEALKKILKNDFALIILDVQMPGMDGFEVAEIISGYSKAKDIPIIFLSAVSVEKKFIKQGYDSGGIDYVTKPVDPDIFIMKVRTFYTLHEQKRELNNIRLALLAEVETRKKAEDKLSRAVDEMKCILEVMPQVAFTMAPDGEIEFANEHWFLYSNNTQSLPAFHPDEEHTSKLLQKAIKNCQAFTAEVRIRNKVTGAWRYHLLKVIPVRQGLSVSKWVGTFTDIHEQKMATEVLERKVNERTEQLVVKNKELETSNYELQQFASVASHDLKEPLRKIQIFSSIIKDRYLNGENGARANIERVIDAAQRMSTLIHDLLNYSRLSVKMLFRKTDIKKLINDIINDLEISITEKNAVINVGDIPVIDAIPGQIRQVFQNLITNSLKFTRPGQQPVIDIYADVVENNGQPCCQITVKDNGIGFHEQYIEKIFTIFQRLNPSEVYEGSGIGLAIVKKIIEKHNGTITAKSTEGKGAEFIICLPLDQSEHSDRSIADLQESK